MYTLPTSLPYVDLLPGPFILLIFIPLLPLALFSLGARPPTGSSFDFLTDELWRTTALLGIAVTVGLCVGVYPSTLEGMGGWLKNGNLSWGSNYFGGANGWFGSPTSSPAIAGRRVVRRVKPSFDRIARNHITALRYYYPRLYRPTTPKSTSVLVLGIIITLSTIVITGKILKMIYDSDTPTPQPRASSSQSSSSKPSAWVSREYESRKKDTDEKSTKKRFKEEEDALVKKYEERKKELVKDEGKYEKYIAQKSTERKKDLEMLRKMLKNKGLEPIGLDIVPSWYVDPNPVVGETTKPKEVKPEEKKVEKEVKAKDPEVLTMGDKIRQALLGRTIAAARKKEKAAASASVAPASVVMAPGTTGRPAPTAAAAVPERGPGWEVASDPTAGVGLATSAGNAEALARGMGK